jgi:predicted nucleic acid-binding protein
VSNVPEIVLLDACVLYPAALRDFMLRLARQDAFRPRWSDPILDEFVRNVLKNIPDLQPANLARTVGRMNDTFSEAVVVDFEHLLQQLHLPDPDDRHVLAAALKAKATTIITMNLKDFPAATLSRHGVAAVHPDAFVMNLLTSDPSMVERAFAAQQQSLKNPPISVANLMDKLERQGLIDSMSVLRVRLVENAGA